MDDQPKPGIVKEELSIKDEDCIKGVSAFLHNVSPIKENDRKVKWFDCDIQLKEGLVRGVYFDPSPTTVEHFTKVAESKSPVKISNFHTSSKRKGDEVDIIIRKKTKVEELKEVPFDRLDVTPTPTTTTIGSLKDLKAGQLLTLTAMANNLGSIKEVNKRATGEKVNVKECQITDPTGSVKLVLWGAFADNILDSQTNKFSNLRLKSENGKVSLGTTQAGCSIDVSKSFPNLKPPKELPSTIKTEKLEVFGISNVASYHVCSTCTKKVVIDPQKNVVKCQNCGMTFHKTKCALHSYAKVVFKKESKKFNFTLFHQNILQVVNIYNESNNSGVPVTTNELTGEQLEELLLSFDSMTVTYDYTNNKVTQISA